MPSPKTHFVRPLSVVLGLSIGALFTSSPVRAQSIERVESSVAGFVGMATQGPLDQPVLVSSMTEFELVFGSSEVQLANPYLAPSVQAFFANGGDRAYVVRVADDDPITVVGQDGGTPSSRSGLQSLLDVDAVSMVAVPGASSSTVHVALIEHCLLAGDRMALLDPAASDDVSGVLALRQTLPAEALEATLYFPWVEATFDEVTWVLPPSGYVAGVWSRTSPHRSPVGELTALTGLTVNVDNVEQELLNPEGINALRDLDTLGLRVWGARTLSSDPEWKYVAVRRQALHLQESIFEGTVWARDEPNDALLWSQLELSLESFLQGLFLEGWFNGATPDDAYFVQVGLGLSMTQEDVDQGRTVVRVGFAPLRPAEFVVLEIVQQRSDPTTAPHSQATAGRLLPARPNPFNPRTEIRFELGEPGSVDLIVYDLSGRRVRQLLSGRHLDAGEHTSVWDGRDGRGAALGSGVYLLQLRSPGGSDTSQVVLLR